MASPTPYMLAYDFTAFQASNPTTPLPADRIEIEFNALQTTTDELITNINLIQRSDGALANDSVGLDQLKPEVTTSLNQGSNWATLTAYALNDPVYQNNNVYRCIEAHTSGTFSTDLAANKWELLLDFDQFVSATAADAVSTAADAVSTAADAVATAADRVQTGLDAASATASANAAAASAAEGMYNNVVSLETSADSPYTPTAGEEGTLFRVDNTSGDFTFNLSALSVYAEDMKFAFVTTAGSNDTIINRGGSDTIDNGATSYTISDTFVVHDLIGDLATTNWVSAIGNANLALNSVALDRLVQASSLTVLGNTTGGAANVSEVSVLDEDDMSSDSATALATQQSIKAYVDNAVGGITGKNLVLGGDLKTSIGGTSFAGISGNQYVSDMLRSLISGTHTSDYDFDRSASTVPDSEFHASLRVNCDTADATVNNDDLVVIQHRLEGNNVHQLAFGTSDAKEFTISFWVRSATTGTFTVSLRNSAANRSYVSEVTIDATNTWEYKTITITADTTGTWLTDENIGLALEFVLRCGSNFHTTAGAWQAGNFLGSSNHDLDFGTDAGDQIFLCGIQLEIGATASAYAHRLMSEEIAAVHRYLYRGMTRGTIGVAQTGARIMWHIMYPVELRGNPTITLLDTAISAGLEGSTSGTNSSSSTINFSSADEKMAQVRVDGWTGLTTGGFYTSLDGNEMCEFDARL